MEPRASCRHCRGIYRVQFSNCPNDGHPLEPMIEDPLVGVTVAGRYVIGELVAEGGSGRIYKAVDWCLDAQFAVKVFFGEIVADLSARTRLIREITAASRLRHPNVVELIEFGVTDEGLAFLVMELVDGPDLADAVAATGGLSWSRSARIGAQVCAGLQHAHDAGIVHRDLKTTNVILGEDPDGEVAKITDFGVSIARDPAPADRITGEGRVVGTLGWMSPEQALGHTPDHRSDLYNVGLLLYEMLAARPPFDGTAAERHERVVYHDVPKIRRRNPRAAVWPQLETLIYQLLDKDPSARPGSARDVMTELDAMLEQAEQIAQRA